MTSLRAARVTTLLLGLLTPMLWSCDGISDVLASKIASFRDCLQNNPKEVDFKQCNAFVALFPNEFGWATKCLAMKNVSSVDYSREDDGSVWELSLSFECENGRELSMSFRKAPDRNDFFIYSVGERVN